MKTLERLKVIWKNEREYLDDVIAIFKRVLVTLAFITFLFKKLLNQPGVTVKAMFVTPHGDEDIIYVVYEEDRY